MDSTPKLIVVIHSVHMDACGWRTYKDFDECRGHQQPFGVSPAFSLPVPLRHPALCAIAMTFDPDVCRLTDLYFVLIPVQMQDVSKTRGVERNEPIHLVDLFTTIVRAVSEDDDGFTFANDVSFLQHLAGARKTRPRVENFSCTCNSVSATVAHNLV